MSLNGSKLTDFSSWLVVIFLLVMLDRRLPNDNATGNHHVNRIVHSSLQIGSDSRIEVVVEALIVQSEYLLQDFGSADPFVIEDDVLHVIADFLQH